MRRWGFARGVLLGCMALGRIVHAAGIEHPDAGALSVGRGGAVAAAPEGGMALQYNPAGLAKQTGLSITLDGKLDWQELKFAPGDGTSGSNSALPYVGPSGVVVSYGFGSLGPLQQFTIALGATGPSAIGKSTFPATGPQRYGLVSSNYLVAFYSVAAAAQFTDWLSAGITFQLAQGTANFAQKVRTRGGTDLAGDALATVNGSSGVIPTGIAGLTFAPHPDWAIGVSYRLPIHFVADGTLVSALPPSADVIKASQNGDSATLKLLFADAVRLGVQYRPITDLHVEVDAVYERWSGFKQLEVDTHNITLESSVLGTSRPLPSIIFPKDYHDAVSVRVGGEYLALEDRLTVRAGYLWESSAIPSKTVNVDFANWGRNAVSVGLSVEFFGAILDLGYAHHFVPTQVVADSIVAQVTTPSLIPGASDPSAQIIGNGTYTASLDVFAIGLRVPLNKLHSSL